MQQRCNPPAATGAAAVVDAVGQQYRATASLKVTIPTATGATALQPASCNRCNSSGGRCRPTVLRYSLYQDSIQALSRALIPRYSLAQTHYSKSATTHRKHRHAYAASIRMRMRRYSLAQSHYSKSAPSHLRRNDYEIVFSMPLSLFVLIRRIQQRLLRRPL